MIDRDITRRKAPAALREAKGIAKRATAVKKMMELDLSNVLAIYRFHESRNT
jgi:hypothetical protein